MAELTMEKLVSLAKNRGFVYAGSEVLTELIKLLLQFYVLVFMN